MLLGAAGQRTVPMFRTSVLPDSLRPSSLSIALTSTFAAEPPFTTDSGNHWGNFFARTKMTNSALSGSTGGVGGGCAAAGLGEAACWSQEVQRHDVEATGVVTEN